MVWTWKFSVLGENTFPSNVQAACDPDLLITNIVAHWHGSANDSLIFRSSSLCNDFKHGRVKGLLVGDAGYTCNSYLMMLLRFPVTQKDRKYNVAHRRTRNVIERTFGVMKQRFKWLQIPLRTDLQHTLPIIIACACPHNYATRLGDTMNTGDNDVFLPHQDDIANTGNQVVTVN